MDTAAQPHDTDLWLIRSRTFAGEVPFLWRVVFGDPWPSIHSARTRRWKTGTPIRS